jgi:hypothetical protein
MTALVPESLKSGEYGVLFIIGHAIKNTHIRLDRLVGLDQPRWGTAIAPAIFAAQGVFWSASGCAREREPFQPVPRIA